jgi:methylated-DNA-[protein]-cysteine S-methyltransferase
VNKPKVSILFVGDADELSMVRLLKSDCFQVHFSDCSLRLQNELLAWINEYLEASPNKITLNLKGTSFQKEVWENLSTIDFGKTKTYKDVAIDLNSPKGARAVGLACHRNPYPLLVPCHRVIHQDKKHSGYAFGNEVKKELLEFESRASLLPIE